MSDCQCFDKSKAVRMPEGTSFSAPTLRALAADHRLCLMPARFRWALEWAAGQVDRDRAAYDRIRSMTEADEITDVVTILRGTSFAAKSPAAKESCENLEVVCRWAADEIEQLRADGIQSRWIPVREMLPPANWNGPEGRHSDRVLLTDGNIVTTAEHVEQDGWSIDYVSMNFGSPVAWMPLPEAPKQ